MRRSGVRIPLAPPQADIRSGCRFFACTGVLLLLAPLVFRAPEGLLWGRAAWCARGRRPAREPSALRAFGSARRLEARPGPAAAHGHRSQAPPPPMGTAAMPSGPSGVLHTGNAWSADVRLGASPRSPARPCRRPWAPQPDPPAPAALFIVVVPGIFSNFARNSLATCSNLEFASLGLQRFRVVSKSDRGKLCAKFVWLCSCCRPPAPRRGAPAPSARFTPVGPGVLLCWLA